MLIVYRILQGIASILLIYNSIQADTYAQGVVTGELGANRIAVLYHPQEHVYFFTKYFHQPTPFST
jgi:hypothetical protein